MSTAKIRDPRYMEITCVELDVESGDLENLEGLINRGMNLLSQLGTVQPQQ